jgi:hypothetical protein
MMNVGITVNNPSFDVLRGKDQERRAHAGFSNWKEANGSEQDDHNYNSDDEGKHTKSFDHYFSADHCRESPDQELCKIAHRHKTVTVSILIRRAVFVLHQHSVFSGLRIGSWSRLKLSKFTMRDTESRVHL